MKVKITKLRSVENPHSKNSTFGESADFHLGMFSDYPYVGERFNLYPFSSNYEERGISTSPVTKILDDNTFETLNSVYKWEFLNNDTTTK